MRSFSQAERSVINALNAHISRNEEVSLTELAGECHVAKSTVVKTLQRMGFRGYQEFSYSFRLSRDVQRGSLLPRDVVVGSGTTAARELASVFLWCAGRKSIAFSDGKCLAAPLAQYLARKLALFDILAPASYDYAMVDAARAEPGAAFFFIHRRDAGVGHGYSGVGEGMLAAVRDRGYRTVIFTDTDDASVTSYADVLIRIADNAEPDIDLYATKVLMVIERALSEYARLREEVRDGDGLS
ncbi:MAG: hypothetical protein QM302_09505 [Acidobacteriota bacterium]|nr:hypothetical protein [Acidobacteriota bacterium]